MSVKTYKISFCIVCMNRLHHLEQTLLANILDNADYPDLEFVMLDYNSSDGLEQYVKTSLQQYIDSGILVYYKTTGPVYFNRSHSRNLAFKLASGDLICNIDADNYTGRHFASYINDEFNKEDKMFLTVIGQLFKKDVLGRICVRREDFYKIRGYDEKMNNYGFEDYDFVNRLELAGIKKHLFENNDSFFHAIPHDQKERLSNEFVSKNLKGILISYLTPSSSDIIYLFADNSFKRYIYVDLQTFVYPAPLTPIQKTQEKYKFSFIEAPFTEGSWKGQENEILLYHGEEFRLSFDQDRKCYNHDDSDFYQITDTEVIDEAVMLYSQIVNRLLMENNKLEGNFAVNAPEFGSDKVYKNFDAQFLITV
jgi:glycosyltransferase involved in cell wall biosynthesis